MKTLFSHFALYAFLSFTTLGSAAAAAAPVSVIAGGPGHAGDIVVGRNDLGQLAAESPIGTTLELTPVSGFLQGWSADEPGFMTLADDEPAENFFTLGAGAVVYLELIAIDPALKVWSPGFISFLTSPGQSFLLGGSDFDTHGTFHIDSTDPSFNPSQSIYSATFRFFDGGTTGYTPSDPFSLSFTPIPEPATALLLTVGLLGFLSRSALSSRRKESRS